MKLSMYPRDRHRHTEDMNTTGHTGGHRQGVASNSPHIQDSHLTQAQTAMSLNPLGPAEAEDHQCSTHITLTTHVHKHKHIHGASSTSMSPLHTQQPYPGSQLPLPTPGSLT